MDVISRRVLLIFIRKNKMNALQLIAILLSLTAIGGFINKKYIHLPTSVGLLLFSTLLSIILIVVNKFNIMNVEKVAHYIDAINFEDLLLHGLLCIFLFAGALNIKIDDLKKYKYSIFNFSTIGVVISTFLIGYAVFHLSHWLGIKLPLLYCLLFGALISPTDAVAVFGILNKHTNDTSLKARINGESLFNDGTAIVLFMTILAFATHKETHFVLSNVVLQLGWKIIGGVVIGWLSAWIISQFFKRIDSYDVEIMFTLALAVGCYALAEIVHVSEPIAVAVAGLFIGNSTRKRAMSQKTKEHLDVFWELLDEILNAVLFILIGLELILIEFNMKIIILSLLSAIAIIIARYISVLFCGLPLIKKGFDIKKLPLLMTWAGLRGGISIALALSVSGKYKELILALTYSCVVFSIVIQGTTLGKVLNFFEKKN